MQRAMVGATLPLGSSDMSLEAASENPMLVVDLYRAMRSGDAEQPIQNDDASDIVGILKYLHTEIVAERSAGPADRASRRNAIDSIHSWRFKVKNPVSLLRSRQGLFTDFGAYMVFDNGQVDDAGSQQTCLADYGDQVGVQDQTTVPSMKSSIPYFWFSLSGFCPNLPFNCTKSWPGCTSGSTTHRCEEAPDVSPTGYKGCPGKRDAAASQYCLNYTSSGQPMAGGLCGGTSDLTVDPTGKPGCVYSYGNRSSVRLDDVVGITDEDCRGLTGSRYKCKDWSDFRSHCADGRLKRRFASDGSIVTVGYCVEYDIHPSCADSCSVPECQRVVAEQQETGLAFWRGRCESQATMHRAEKVASLFGGLQQASESHRLIANDLPEPWPSCLWAGPRSECHPDPTRGGTYCTREWSGVCHPCYIPGTIHGYLVSGTPVCPLDLLTASTDYSAMYRPRCRSTTPSDLCCLYSRSCTASNASISTVSLDWDGLLLVAREANTSMIEFFLGRIANSNGWDWVIDPGGLRKFAYWLWFLDPNNHDWTSLSGKPQMQASRFESIVLRLNTYIVTQTTTTSTQSSAPTPRAIDGNGMQGVLALGIVIVLILTASIVGVAWERRKRQQERVLFHSGEVSLASRSGECEH